MNRFKREIRQQLAQHNKPNHDGAVNVVVNQVLSQQHCTQKAGLLPSLHLRNAVSTPEQKQARAARDTRNRIRVSALQALKHLKVLQGTPVLHPRIQSDLIMQARREGHWVTDSQDAIGYLWHAKLSAFKRALSHSKAPSVLLGAAA